MRLVAKVDGSVDRFDRAVWLTMPFDLALFTPALGSIILDEVLCDPAIFMDDAVVPTLIMDDWSTNSAGIELSSVEMV